MFNIKGKIIVCDMSKFSYGLDITIISDGKIVSKLKADDLEEAMGTVYLLCRTEDIKNVFVRPLAPVNNGAILNKFKEYGQTNFSKVVDKIHFHML